MSVYFRIFTFILLSIILTPTSFSDELVQNTFGFSNSQVVMLSEADIAERTYISHGNIPTLEGVIVYQNNQPTVHILDPKEHRGHLKYVQQALGRGAGYLFSHFAADIIYPESRRYLPFTVYRLDETNPELFWVFQARRYKYQDSQQLLTLELKLAQELVQKTLIKTNSAAKILIYQADIPARQPNRKHLASFKAFNLDAISEVDMINIANANLVSILNGGTVCGTLKHHSQSASEDEDLTELYSMQDIVVFDHIPERIPPLAGIITLEAQTPLSHVNLLAINRGTVNMSASNVDDIDNLDVLLTNGSAVLLKADQQSGKFTINEISKEALLSCVVQQLTAIKTVAVPSINPVLREGLSYVDPATDTNNTSEDIVSHLIDFRTKQLYPVSQIGAKAANYANMIHWTIEQPAIIRPAFALDFSAYFSVIRSTGADTQIAKLLHQKNTMAPTEINSQLKAIRKTIEDAEFSHELATLTAQIRQTVTALMPTAVRFRLRSSTNAEDLPNFNGAGLYESKGFNLVDPDEKMAGKLLDVLASLWYERAFWEREYHGIDHTQVAMAVLFNEAFSDEFGNGVALIQKQGDEYAIWINAQTGENSVTNPLTGEVPESIVLRSSNNGSHWNIADFELISVSNFGQLFLENSDLVLKASIPLLTELAMASQRVFENMTSVQKNGSIPYAVDLEFKIMKSEGEKSVYIKQGRLIAIEQAGLE